MPSELDHAPHLLMLEVEADTESALMKGAKSVLETAGATFEVIQAKQPADLAVACGFAVTSNSFDAFVILADVKGDDGLHRQLSGGLQQLALDKNISIALGVESSNFDEDAHKAGADAARSALRLFAIKARFNPSLNEA